jgi:plasmid stabilization system protein ParE
MDYQVDWSPEAVEDVEQIAAYIHKDSPLYAQQVVEELIAAGRRLSLSRCEDAKCPSSRPRIGNASHTAIA